MRITGQHSHPILPDRGRDPKIVFRDRLALQCQTQANITVNLCCVLVRAKQRHDLHKFVEFFEPFLRLARFQGSIVKFTVGG